MLFLVISVIIIAGVIWAIKLQNKIKLELIAEVNAALKEELDKVNFVTTRTIDVECYQNNLPNNLLYTKFLIDDTNKKFAIFSYSKLKQQQFTCLNYSDLINFNLFDDGEQQLQGRGMLTAVGALTFGIAGAIVGSVAGDRKIKNKCKELSVRIQVNDVNTPLIAINCLTNCDKNNIFYKNARQTADDLVATLTYIENSK